MESPIHPKDGSYTSAKDPIPAKPQQSLAANVNTQRRRTLSDYRTTSNARDTSSSDSPHTSKPVSNIKSTTKSLASGIGRFASKGMVSISIKFPLKFKFEVIFLFIPDWNWLKKTIKCW